jgi:hypothetical protein
VHAGDWDKIDSMAQQWRRQKPRCVDGVCLFIVASSVVIARIYREDLPRITASHNRLGLSIKHVLDTGS